MNFTPNKKFVNSSLVHSIYYMIVSCLLLRVTKIREVIYQNSKSRAQFAVFEELPVVQCYPQVLVFRLLHASSHDTKSVRKHFPRGAIRKQNREMCDLHANLEKLSSTLRNYLSSLEWYILKSSVNRNVERAASSVVETHRKKICQLTKNSILQFLTDDVADDIVADDIADEAQVIKEGRRVSDEHHFETRNLQICLEFFICINNSFTYAEA